MYEFAGRTLKSRKQQISLSPMIMAIITVFCIIGNNLPTEKEIQCSYHYLQQSNCHLFLLITLSWIFPANAPFHAFTSTNYVYFFPNIWKIFLLILHITTPPLWFSPIVCSWGFQIKKQNVRILNLR